MNVERLTTPKMRVDPTNLYWSDGTNILKLSLACENSLKPIARCVSSTAIVHAP